jgi:hypothetical protein
LLKKKQTPDKEIKRDRNLRLVPMIYMANGKVDKVRILRKPRQLIQKLGRYPISLFATEKMVFVLQSRPTELDKNCGLDLLKAKSISCSKAF